MQDCSDEAAEQVLMEIGGTDALSSHRITLKEFTAYVRGCSTAVKQTFILRAQAIERVSRVI